MKLVLDANVFCQDYRLGSTNFRLLHDGLDVVPADLKVPEVVVDEVVNRYREDLEAARALAQKADAALVRLVGTALKRELGSLAVAIDADEYRASFLSGLKKLRAEILPYPDTPHKRAVERDLQRRRPFKRNGSGYRDFLIWESVRRLMMDGTERVVLVTGNTADFGEGPRVAADLQEDVLNPDRLELLPGLKAFNDKFVVPRMKMLFELRLKLQALDVGRWGRWLRKNLLDLLRQEDLGSVVVGFPDGVGSVWPVEIVLLGDVTISEVRELPNSEKFVRLVVSTDVDFRVDIDWEDYTLYREVRDWAGEASEPFSSSSSHQVSRLEVGIDLLLDTKAEELVNEEISSIHGPFGTIEQV